jgi:hypothetical protein
MLFQRASSAPVNFQVSNYLFSSPERTSAAGERIYLPPTDGLILPEP